MADNLGNSVIKLQKEIIDITKNINSVRIKTHKSMSSILNNLKSFPKDKPINQKYISLSINNKNSKKFKQEENYLFINNDEDYKRNNNSNFYQPKIKVNNLQKRNKGIGLNKFENQYNNNIKIEKPYKHNLILDNFNIKKIVKKPIQYEEKKSRNYKFDRNDLDGDFYTFNERKTYQDSDSKKSISKHNSLKYIYKGRNYPNKYNYTYDGKNNIYIGNTYFKNNDTNYYYKSELDNGNYINRLLNKKIDINIKPNIRSRNKNENFFKYKESETQKNGEELIEYEDILYDKNKNTIYNDIFPKYNNRNHNKINNSFSINKNNIISPSFKTIFNHSKKNKNMFRKKASTKATSKENKFNKLNDIYPYNTINIEEIDKINNIYKLLNANNYRDCVFKINKLLSYEDFIHKIKNFYFQYNDINKDFELKDILFWLSFHFNDEDKINKYEDFCREIMKNFSIPDFENFKIFFNKLVYKDKNSKDFVKGMKDLFNSFNDLQPNISNYRNKTKKRLQKIFYNNEDDIDN